MLLEGTCRSPKVKWDSLKYRIKMGVNDGGPHFRTWGGGKELTPHCLVIACCNRNKQNPAFHRLIPLFNKLPLPLWPLTACWASLRGCELGVRDIVSDSSHFLQISGGKSPVPCWGRSVLHFRVGESFQVHKPLFLPLFLSGQVLTLGNTGECDSISHTRLAGWQRNESNTTY